ncbi:D-alanyl-D-alanine carboxypeptidase family protein [Marinicrinis lubricantis]|uniref:serine-type D-Ala-D-Ala carboxypeptidase n=1 Tax=Marinicrinis lubricantis TaxID=2086470 RepID=A0ABW1IK92_9BACL
MLRKLKKVTVSICLLIMIQLMGLSILSPSTSFAAEIPTPSLQVKSAILIEASTGQVLYSLNADEARPPASMAKMMTEYVVMTAIKEGRITPEDQVTISHYAAEVIGSGQQLAEGKQFTVRDLLRNMIIYSGNDAAVALAEYVGNGSETNFVQMMNEAAKEMGLSDTAYFANATGLSNAEDLGQFAPDVPGETMISAEDVAKLARRLITDFPESLEFSSIPRTTLHEDDPNSTQIDNWNWMLEGWKEYNNNFSAYAYDGMDGLKTGHTDEAGYCFTGTAERDGMRLISVVMGAANEPERFNQTRVLMDYGFNNFEMKTILAAKSKVEALETVHVKKAKDTDVPVVVSEGVVFAVRKGEVDDAFKLEASPMDEKELVAPIKEGDKVGQVTVTYNGPNGEVKQTVDLLAAEDADKANWFILLMRAIKEFFVNLIDSIKNLF